jgi:predicted Zn-dependent protease
VIQLVAPSTAILDPGSDNTSVDDMIAATRDGIYFSRGGSASMDPARMNMQFQAPSGLVYKIKNGRLTEMVRYAAFQARSPDLWKNMDMIGGQNTFKFGGGGTGKGDPFEIIGRTVGCPAGRFKQLNIVAYGRRG